MLTELSQLPPSRKYFYINLFKVDERATVEDIRGVFKNFDLVNVIKNKSLPGIFDLKLPSQEEFRKVLSENKYFFMEKPFYYRFSEFRRQPQLHGRA